MITLFEPKASDRFWEHSVVSIGTFDGVHLGHQALLCKCVEEASAEGWPSIAVTFDRNPLETLRPEHAPKRIQSLHQTLDSIADSGIDIAVVLHFDSELAQTSADNFFEQILVSGLGAQTMVVGHDFAFGKSRVGTPQWLADRIATHVVPPLMIDDVRVSSSAIREAVSLGDVASAANLLGKDFALSGTVAHGRKVGRTLGYPTANLIFDELSLTPADGVYAGTASIASGNYMAAIGIGMRPTVGGNIRTVEAFMIGYNGPDIYGRAMQLAFNSRIRDELKFEDLEALKTAMDEDVRIATEILRKT